MREYFYGVTVDNGGSEVRVLPKDGTIEDLIKCPNDFVTIEEKDFRVKDVSDKVSLVRFTKADKPEFLGIIAAGLTGHAYKSKALTITSQKSKTSNINYYRQLLFGLALNSLSVYMDRLADKNNTDCPNFKLNYVLVDLIPAEEFSGGQDCAKKLKDMLAGTYEIEFPLLPDVPKLTFVIKPEWTGVVPEGGVAITARKKELEPTDISLVVDIGHISTEILLFEGTEMKGTVATSWHAGSTLASNVKTALKNEGYNVNNEQVLEILKTGKVRKGAQSIDVTDLLNEQRDLFVKNYLHKDIVDVLITNDITPDQIQNFIPIGAPMNSDKLEGSIIESIVDTCDLEYAKVSLLADDLRYVNIMQASLFTKRLFKAVTR